MKIFKFPNILIINFKRFKFSAYSRTKLDNEVIFPIKNFDLGRLFNDSTDISKNDAIYNLVGVINHSGNLGGGHYTA